MQLIALSGAQENTAFTGLVQVGEHSLLIDAGVRLDPSQGMSARPNLNSLQEKPPSAILLTHAHIDQVGSLPLIVERCPQVPIFATKGTLSLLRVLFFEGVRSTERDQLEMEKESFMFRPQFLREILNRIRAVSFGETFQPIPNLQATYFPAGHIFGAGMLRLEGPDQKDPSQTASMLFTGDCSVRSSRIIEGLSLESLPATDIMVCGARHGEQVCPPQEEQEQRLLEQINAVLRNNGRVLFPCFAVGRAQELILMCREAQANGKLIKAPIFLDGAVRAASQVLVEQRSDTIDSFQALFKHNEDTPFLSADGNVYHINTPVERRRVIRSNGRAAIIFTSSGMLEGGPSPIYAQGLASDRKSAIFLNSHQDDESPGSAFQRCRSGETVTLGRKRVVLDCQVFQYSYSMHADAQELRDIVRHVQPHQLILTQSDGTGLVRLGRQFPKVTISVPQLEQPLALRFEQSERSVEVEEEPSEERPVVVDSLPDADYVPDVSELYDAVLAHGDMERTWSSGEIAANFYKKSYQPQHRKMIKQLLDFCEPYFLRRRHGSDWVYSPQEPESVEKQHRLLKQVKALVPGDIVLVKQVTQDQGPPRLGIVQRPFKGGHLSIIADSWKSPKQDWKVVKLIPGIHHDGLTDSSLLPAFRDALSEWLGAIKDEAVDLLTMWVESEGKSLTFDEMLAGNTRPTYLIALGLELLDHGLLLWEWDGELWTPREREDLRIAEAVFQTHQQLRESQRARVQHTDGRKGRLTGRIHWDTAEVLWDASSSFVRQERLDMLEEEPESALTPETEQTISTPTPPATAVADEPAPAPIAQQADAETDDAQDEDELVEAAPDAQEMEDLSSIKTGKSLASTLSATALQQLLKDEGILRPRKDIRKMEREELVKHFGSKRSGRIVFARLFRSLVWQAYQWIQKGKEEPVRGGMQTFWYRWCLPALKQAPEYRKMKFEPYDLMCRTFTQMVFELGLFSYADFGFTDLNQRNRLIGKKRPQVLIFAEKALWYPLLEELSLKHGVSCIAFYGTPSSLTTEYTARELMAACGTDATLHLVGIVSFSPAGDIAARSFQQQLSRVGFPNTTIRTVIHPKHYSEEELELYRVPVPTRQQTKVIHWMEKTGGIDGEVFGLESESMPRERLLSLIEQYIEDIANGVEPEEVGEVGELDLDSLKVS
jgi:Cft2 family RNA processing exonuclease